MAVAIEVRLLGSDEAAVLERVAPDVFDEPVDPRRSAEFLADARHHLAVALDGDVVVGMASAVDYVHPDKPVQLWINELGVAPPFQRRGLGRRLLEVLLERGRELGCREAWLGTEPDNEAACGLYAAAGGSPETFVMYSFEIAAGDGGESSEL